MFVHHVYFWLKNPDNSADYNQMLNGLKGLSQIEPKIMIHIGVAGPLRADVIDSSYTFSLLLTFDSQEDQNAYDQHPVHQQFIQENSPLWEKVTVFDSITA